MTTTTGALSGSTPQRGRGLHYKAVCEGISCYVVFGHGLPGGGIWDVFYKHGFSVRLVADDIW